MSQRPRNPVGCGRTKIIELMIREARNGLCMLSSSEIARRTGTHQTYVTATISGLAESGYVERIGKSTATIYRLSDELRVPQNSTRIVWYDDLIDQLLSLRAQGATFKVSGHVLGVSRHAVAGKIRRLAKSNAHA